jgi:dTDP-4-dehydrorhamnose reductase
VLDTSRLQRDFGIVPPDWREGLQRTLDGMTPAS